LNARNLVKERRYLRAAGELLARHGATAETAALAAGIAAACYLTAQVATAANPARLPDGVGRPSTASRKSVSNSARKSDLVGDPGASEDRVLRTPRRDLPHLDLLSWARTLCFSRG
jgi:hypothetical protein